MKIEKVYTMMAQTVSEEEFMNSKLPGATRVIGEVFGTEEFSAIPEKVMEEAIKRGKAVHEAIERFIHTGEEKIDFEYREYFDSFLEWYQKYQPEFLASELRVMCPELGFKGVIDVVFRVGNTLVMGDFKTSSKLNTFKGTLQLNMYKIAFERLKLIDENINELRMVKLSKKDYKYVNIDIDESLVMSLLKLFTFKRSQK